MMLAIIGGIVVFGCIAVALIVRNFRTRKLELRPARQPLQPQPVVLRYASGTTVALDEPIEPLRHTAAGSVVSPMPRRRMPGLMPTAGYVVVPKQRPSRTLVAPKIMDFSDD